MTPSFVSTKSRRGFTLLELIVALAMVTIMAMSLYASLRAAFRAKSSAEAAIEPSRTAGLIMEFLRTDLQNALPPTGILAGAFSGTDGKDERGRDSDDLVFYSTAESPEHPSGNGEVKKVELLVTMAPTGNDHLLVRRVTRNLLSELAVDPDEEVLARGIGAFNVRYYDGAGWVDTWDSSAENNALPAAVEVTIELDRPTRPANAADPPY
ncbi:MAG TPA: GspJ family type II secretion system protein, partial [Tepidisphaeraceae bacterium]